MPKLGPILRKISLLCGLTVAGPSLLALATSDIPEYGMKAMLFYRLSQFVYWPGGEKPGPTPVLCIAGSNPFGSALNQIAANAGIEVRSAGSDPSGCHLIFIARSETAALERWLQRAEQKRIVTVSDIPGFARQGGMIELPLEGERVAIVVNRRNAQKQGFEFNTQLLRLARGVE